jgi:hypothetical protein
MNSPMPEPATATGVVGTIPHRAFRPESRARQARAWPSGVIGALALVVVIEWAVAYAGPKFLGEIAADWALSMAATKRHATGKDMIFVGDSLIKHGLVPRFVDEATGRRSYNFAASASSVPSTEALLRSAFDAGATPQVVILDFKPSILVGGPKYQVAQWPQVLGFLDIWRLSVEMKSLPFAAELFLNKLSPTLRSRYEIRQNVSSAIQGLPSRLQRINAINIRNWTVNQGADVSFLPEGFSGVVSDADHEKLLTKWFRPHRVNVLHAHRVLELIHEHHAQTYVLLAPYTPALHARRVETGVDAKYEAFIRSLQAEHPELVVLDARSSGYPVGAFVDPIHLGLIGSLALSADVGEIVRADLDGKGPGGAQRWVKLPPFRARPIPADVEDVNHSTLKVDAEAGK